ncbi:MAG TPA: pyridoxamine 5'-phosphate oxidase family protein [Candidatus Limnocylindrales bacterium]|nr:pyridoxamine 5'-phosphate oxidase family protein [Candidatus Limnocylindrales bacterium]
MKVADSSFEMAALQRLLESSPAASPALADSVAFAPRRMSAAELASFWSSIRLVAMATVGPSGQPHIAPVHAELRGDELSVQVYADATRRRDLQSNPRVAFTAWDSEGAVAILYGRAREVEGSLRSARPSQAGREREVVEILVRLTRVYAMSAKKVCAPSS